MTMIRGNNPVWFEVDLDANPFDDTFYLFVLQNTFPYLPATVWHDANGTIPWNSPIQFLANGTLPIDIYFDPTQVYRLEFRQGNTQSSPLIYLVENYIPGTSGNTPIDTVALVSDNQITNPQFSLVNFSTPFEITAGSTQEIDVAPGWVLDLTGSGNVTLTQVQLNNSAQTINPTNAPYALQITLSGTWTTSILRQRFQQNGMLWANKTVASSVTARIEGAPQSIEARLVDSNGTQLAEILASVPVDSTFTQYQGYGTLPATTNPDLPPAAYIDYELLLPNAVDIYLTSFQVVAQDVQTVIPFTQDSIDRQIDYTWHYYRDSVILQPKDSILTGWDFGLNPWQSRAISSSNVAANEYTAEQTIVVQQAYVQSATGNNVAVSRASFTQNYGFTVTAVTANNQFAIIQYIDPSDIRPYWGSTLSSLVKLNALKQGAGSNLHMKARLIYRASLPPTIAQDEPISSWVAGSNPTFKSGWTQIAPKNDPVYNLSNGNNTLIFEGMTLPTSTNDDMTLAIVIYILNDMNETGTPDNIVFNNISLVPNEFAIESNTLSFEQTLSKCEYHYESSYNPFVLPGTITDAGTRTALQRVFDTGGSLDFRAGSWGLIYNTAKRIATPVITTYSPTSATPNLLLAELFNAGASIASGTIAKSNYTINAAQGKKATYYVSANNTNLLSPAALGNAPEAFILYHYTINARLGI